MVFSWLQGGSRHPVANNGLITSGHLDPKKFKKVKLIEIAPTRPAGFFHYFIEREAVFDWAYEKSIAAFEAEKVCQKAPFSPQKN